LRSNRLPLCTAPLSLYPPNVGTSRTGKNVMNIARTYTPTEGASAARNSLTASWTRAHFSH
jgi:hypothetical protein